MNINRILICCLTSIFCMACGTQKESVRQHTSFNNDWTFHLGDVAEAIRPDYDDSGWRKLNLPHDWAIEGAFSAENPSGAGGGALPGGIGWYRKVFTPGKEIDGKRVFIDFDGVYMNSEVFINGQSLGIRPFGYISFRYDLTPYLKYGEPNVMAVRVDNSDQPNSRWYSGCGIYRNTWLTVTHPVHIDQWGTYLTTPEVSAKQATVAATTIVKNDHSAIEEAEIQTLIYNAEGKKVAQSNSSTVRMAAGDTARVQQQMILDKPHLWDVESPYLYTVRTEIRLDGQLVDTYDTPLGVRSFRFDAERGFILNGREVKIKGVCQHHDLGCLGAAVNTRAIERQLEILREMGCNGIRCSHNPPAPELLDLCDRMGFIVMDETFDMWRKKKTAHDYARYFNEWHERDLTDHILRDRNHPSVFMWSIGNEVLEQWDQADADTLSLEEANLVLNFGHEQHTLAAVSDSRSINELLTQKLANIARGLDPTRPITAGCNEPRASNHLFRANALDIIGYNYHEKYIKDVPRNFPGKPFIFAESTSGLMTRGYYRMPSDSMYIWPERWDKPFTDPSFSCSSYDNCHVPWGSTHEVAWLLTKQNPFVSGLYVWTGFDYLGEPTPYGFPARSSYFGIIDLAGFPKDVYYMYQSEWTEKPVLHLFPHWNWEPGQTLDMWAYYNQADEVELYINGTSQGIRRKGDKELHVSWRVRFEPGTVRIVSRKAGKEVLTKEIHTAGVPAHIRLTADRKEVKADGLDLSFITVEVTDANGNLCPHADNLIQFAVEGSAFIAGVDNGCQTSMESFKAPQRQAFNGKCLVVLQNNGTKGSARLTATSDNLKESITINGNN